MNPLDAAWMMLKAVGRESPVGGSKTKTTWSHGPGSRWSSGERAASEWMMGRGSPAPAAERVPSDPPVEGIQDERESLMQELLRDILAEQGYPQTPQEGQNMMWEVLQRVSHEAKHPDLLEPPITNQPPPMPEWYRPEEAISSEEMEAERMGEELMGIPSAPGESGDPFGMAQPWGREPMQQPPHALSGTIPSNVQGSPGSHWWRPKQPRRWR